MTPDTVRLTAERLDLGHRGILCELHRDPRVMATLGGVRDDSWTDSMLDTNLAHWETHGFGLWIFRERSSGAFVSRAGLRHVKVEGRGDEVELAYTVTAPFWGRGLATEIGDTLLAFGRTHLSLDDIVAFTLPTNRGSRSVMEKLGMRYERDIVHHDLPHVLYRSGV